MRASCLHLLTSLVTTQDAGRMPAPQQRPVLIRLQVISNPKNKTGSETVSALCPYY